MFSPWNSCTLLRDTDVPKNRVKKLSNRGPMRQHQATDFGVLGCKRMRGRDSCFSDRANISQITSACNSMLLNQKYRRALNGLMWVMPSSVIREPLARGSNF